MKAQLEKELKDLAVEILSMQHQNTNDLKHKVAQIYERLCVLAYTENQTETIKIADPDTTPEKEFTTINEVTDFVGSLAEETDEITAQDTFTTETVVEREIPSTSETKPISEILSEIIPENNNLLELESVADEPKVVREETLLVTEETDKPEATPEKDTHAPALLHELEALTSGFDLPEFDPISTPTETTNNPTTEVPPVFEPVISKASENQTKVNDVIATQQKSSLNDSLKKSIQIGLNDRIGFIKHLFDGNQDDYTRVLSQLNTFETNTEAINFINQMVKPEYNNWENKEAFETRFLEVVFRKFDTL
ncbi:hypothetical protein [Aquimarina agarilytica]|uniref:hypothetical protein n=1 Tax=Aquimarina agarilytica TaxID=1087449 RepID=UPI000287D86C|nr:hypothetical protein [Aquimarina agarilytica]